jgi:outer membrane protein assembly factor BamB
MASPQETTAAGPRRGLSFLRAIGLRVIVWGGLALAALIYSGTLPWFSGTETSPAGTEESDHLDAEGPSQPAWPNLRGPTYDGVSAETDLAERWPADGPPVLWQREIGRGYSGLICVGNRVYTQKQTALEQSLVCLDANSGSLVWEHRYGWAYEPAGMYPGPRATPTCHAGRIYFAAPDGLVGCVRAQDGVAVWSVNVNQKFAGRGTEFGYACSPLVVAGKVILPVGGPQAAVVALDANDGSTVWASGSDPASYGSAIPITLFGRRLVIAFLQNVLAGLDIESGQILWRREYSHGYDEHSAQPLYEEPHLMVMLPFRAGADLYRFEPQTASQDGQPPANLRPHLLRHTAQLSNDTASSVLFRGHVYGFDLQEPQANGRRPSRGEFRCLEFPGGRVRWSTDRAGHATVLAADEKLLLFNDKGELILARASPERYEELGRTKVFSGEICWTAPALCRGRIYLRSLTRAACLAVGRPMMAEPDRTAIATGRMNPPEGEPADLVWLIGREREYPFDPPDLRELTRWYLWSLLGSLGGAAIVAALIYGTAARVSPNPRLRLGRSAFWTAVFLLAMAVTPLANRFEQGFVFTWPVAVFAAHQLALVAIVGSQRRTGSGLRGWLATCAVVGFVVVCVGYYELCRRLNLAPAWTFLMGFLPSWPAAIPAARRLLDHRSLLGNAICIVLAFTLFFWGSAACGWMKIILTR